MNIRPKVRNAVLVGALAAVAASAWATNEVMTQSKYMPANPVTAEQPVADESIAVNDSLSPNEVVVTTSDATKVETGRSVGQPGLIVEERRLTRDERIQAAVMDKLASNPRLSGKIGVESNDAVVRLTGFTSTVGQADRAGRDARSVIGVRYVQNEIRARVGGSV